MRCASLLVVLGVSLIPRAAAAELRLSWNAPKECPTESYVRDAVSRTASPNASREAVDADVFVEHGDRWSVTIRTKRAGVVAADRRLDATSCEALADATAVILAMALVPADAAPSPAPLAPPPPAPVPARLPESPASSPDPRPRAMSVSASLVADTATLPSPALGGRAHLAWTPGRARLGVSGGYFAGQSKATGSSAAGATLSLVTAGARACWAVARTAVELAPCVGGDVQIMKASGYGAEANFDASALWLAATAGALVRLPVTAGFAIRADIDAVVPLARPRFIVEGDGAVHKPANLGLRAGIGAELLFL